MNQRAQTLDHDIDDSLFVAVLRPLGAPCDPPATGTGPRLSPCGGRQKPFTTVNPETDATVRAVDYQVVVGRLTASVNYALEDLLATAEDPRQGGDQGAPEKP